MYLQQIQQRCGEPNMQLPRWSVNTEKEIIGDHLNEPLTNGGQYPGDGVTRGTNDSANDTTTILKSENITNTIYKNYNGFEKTFETDSEFDKNDDVFEESGVESKNISQTQSEKDIENTKHISRHSPRLFEKDKLAQEEVDTNTVSDVPKDTLGTETAQKSDISSAGIPKDRENIIVDETRSANPSDKLEKMKDDCSLANLNQDIVKHDSEEKRANSPRMGDTGVQLVLNVSNFNSDGDTGDGEPSRGNSYSRHILKPVDERITVEILQSKSNDSSEKTSVNVGYNPLNLTDEDSRMQTVSLNHIAIIWV